MHDSVSRKRALTDLKSSTLLLTNATAFSAMHTPSDISMVLPSNYARYATLLRWCGIDPTYVALVSGLFLSSLKESAALLDCSRRHHVSNAVDLCCSTTLRVRNGTKQIRSVRNERRQVCVFQEKLITEKREKSET